ncbi:odorant receptor 63a-like [Anastrepha ludens]|uniref:odorant receptor 63a-like n=1 Tax=Anastrepha ludens TaxID=28586 RepID=UPI0023B08D34|nr:odorant receptor 63a-like [Anastrepha ludens]
MYSATEMEELKTRNRHGIRELLRIAYIVGVNLTTQTSYKKRLLLINVLLIIASSIGLYPHWILIQKAEGNIPLIAETATTALQTTTIIVRMVYYLFAQHKFQNLLHKAETHEILQSCEIFKTDMPIRIQLKQEVNAIMSTAWQEARWQLLLCISCTCCILSNYFFCALLKNLYHQIMGPPDYVYILPFTGYPMFLDKGVFCYAMDMFFGACCLIVAGMGGVALYCPFLILCKNACGLVRSLSMLLERSTAPLVPKHRRDEYLRYCVIQHQRTLDFINDVNQLFKHISLSQFLHSLVIYGLVLYEMNFGLESNKVIFVRMIMYICAALTGDCMYYINGQQLATELEAIPVACYRCEWYNESEEFKKTLQMIIMRSNKSFFFEISWFGIMSLTTLLGIARASFSYFVLLQDIEEK